MGRWIVVIAWLCSVGLHAGAFREVPKRFARAVQAIEALPEAQDLLERVEREGPVRLVAGRGAFGGFWEGGSSRTITVVDRSSLGAIIGTILFELHNAASDHLLQSLIDHAQHGRIDREGYVEGVERVEHRTALSTSELIECGIAKGVFPESTRFYVLPDFEDHFRYQQWAGHSQWIAAYYDQMFRG